jgi:hypothetical protein
VSLSPYRGSGGTRRYHVKALAMTIMAMVMAMVMAIAVEGHELVVVYYMYASRRSLAKIIVKEKGALIVCHQPIESVHWTEEIGLDPLRQHRPRDASGTLVRQSTYLHITHFKALSIIIIIVVVKIIMIRTKVVLCRRWTRTSLERRPAGPAATRTRCPPHSSEEPLIVRYITHTHTHIYIYICI